MGRIEYPDPTNKTSETPSLSPSGFRIPTATILRIKYSSATMSLPIHLSARTVSPNAIRDLSTNALLAVHTNSLLAYLTSRHNSTMLLAPIPSTQQKGSAATANLAPGLCTKTDASPVRSALMARPQPRVQAVHFSQTARRITKLTASPCRIS